MGYCISPPLDPLSSTSLPPFLPSPPFLSQVGHMMFLEKPTLFRDVLLHACRDILPPCSPAVTAAAPTALKYSIALDSSHHIPLDMTSMELIRLQGTSGVRRLANGWGIG